MKRAAEPSYDFSNASAAVGGKTQRFDVSEGRVRMGSLTENGVFQGASPVTAVMRPAAPPGGRVQLPSMAGMAPGAFPGTMTRVGNKREGAGGAAAGGGGGQRGGSLIDTITTPPTIVNQTLGWPSNNTVYYQRKSIKLVDALYFRALSNNQFTFIRARPAEGNPAARAAARRHPDKRLEELANLPMLNYILANDPIYQHLDPVRLMREWAPEGVITYENGNKITEKECYVEMTNVRALSRPFGAHVIPANQGPHSRVQRALHRILCGFPRSLLLQIWGNNLEAGTPLFFIIKVIEVPDSYVIDPKGQETRLTREREDGKKRVALQFVPYASSTRPEPPSSALRYHLPDGTMHLGVAVQVGRVEHRTRDANPGNVNAAPVSNVAQINAQPISIFVDVRSPIVY